MKTRIFRTLDGLRGAAALLIVLRHAEFFFRPYSFQKSYLAVDLFFVMSGVVLCHSYEEKLRTTLSPWRFAWIRIARIHPLYLLGCAIAIMAILLNPDSTIHARDLPKLLLLALFLLPNLLGADTYPLNAPSWSLFFELLINFVYGFASRLLTSRAVAVIVGISGVMLIPILIFSKHHNFNLGFTVKSFPTGLFRVAYSFFAGVLLCRVYKAKPVEIGGLAGNAASWAMLMLVVGLLTTPVADAYQSAYDFVVVVVAFPLLVFASLRLVMSGASSTIFRFLGVTSYAIYVLHAPAARLIESRLPAHELSVAPYAPWAGLVFLMVLVSICYVIDRVYDTPVRRLLLGSFARRGAVERVQETHR